MAATHEGNVVSKLLEDGDSQPERPTIMFDSEEGCAKCGAGARRAYDATLPRPVKYSQDEQCLILTCARCGAQTKRLPKDEAPDTPAVATREIDKVLASVRADIGWTTGHDDGHAISDWMNLIADRVLDVRRHGGGYDHYLRSKLVHIAALAAAAVQSQDRIRQRGWDAQRQQT